MGSDFTISQKRFEELCALHKRIPDELRKGSHSTKQFQESFDRTYKKFERFYLNV